MAPADDQARAARQLLAGAFHGVLSTQSAEHAGYPFGSVVPFVLDQQGMPLLLLSHLSQHTRNIDADARCGLTLLGSGEGDVQQRARLSAIGDVIAAADTADAERYFDYYPQAAGYYRELGFRFYRFEPIRFHWNAGFATARWFAAGRVLRANPLDCDTQARIIAHMNRDHRDALHRYLDAAAPRGTGVEVFMVGIDAAGIDLRIADRLYRVALPRDIASAEEARAVLVEMASPPTH